MVKEAIFYPHVFMDEHIKLPAVKKDNNVIIIVKKRLFF